MDDNPFTSTGSQTRDGVRRAVTLGVRDFTLPHALTIREWTKMAEKISPHFLTG
jgi:hypothetical protein